MSLLEMLPSMLFLFLGGTTLALIIITSLNGGTNRRKDSGDGQGTRR